MLVRDLLNQINKYKNCKLACPVYFGDSLEMHWIFVEKTDFINEMKKIENAEIKCKLETSNQKNGYIELIADMDF